MEPTEGEFGPLLLEPILAGEGVDPQPPLQHEALAHHHAVLEILGQVAPAHHLQLARGIIRAEAIDAHGHLRPRGLVVLGVANLRSFQHLHLEQAVIHTPTIGLDNPS